MGSGGAPEGVLAAAALRCVGGQFQGRLLFRNDDERARARRWGVEDLDRIYQLEDLAKGDVIFAATGVTDGSLLDGVKRRRTCITTESVVMRASPARCAGSRASTGRSTSRAASTAEASGSERRHPAKLDSCLPAQRLESQLAGMRSACARSTLNYRVLSDSLER